LTFGATGDLLVATVSAGGPYAASRHARRGLGASFGILGDLRTYWSGAYSGN